MRAWHFTADKLRDGSPIPPVGQVLRFDGEVKICKSGLHYSEQIIDALRYAPGHMIHRVEVNDIVDTQADKGVCRERTILWTVDGEALLREFVRWCALQVIHLWDAPDVVRKYLETGDESLRAAAGAAAWAAAGAAAGAARAAAWAATGAARAVAWAAAWDAAWAATEDAARAAQNTQLEAMVRRFKDESDNHDSADIHAAGRTGETE